VAGTEDERLVSPEEGNGLLYLGGVTGLSETNAASWFLERESISSCDALLNICNTYRNSCVSQQGLPQMEQLMAEHLTYNGNMRHRSSWSAAPFWGGARQAGLTLLSY
jgi:hypothetical protein